jgi:hypothetical protein
VTITTGLNLGPQGPAGSGGGGGALPGGGSVGQAVVNTAPGAGTWQNVNFNNLAGTLNLATQSSGTLASANVGSGYPWNLLGNANGAMSVVNGTNNSSFHHTSAATWLWDNTTAATVTVPQNSPIWNWCGTSWSGSASQADCISIQVQPGVGANPAVTISVGHAGSTGAVTWVFPGPIQSGTAGTAGGLVLPQGTAIPTPQAQSFYITSPTSIPTRYGFIVPSADATGLFYHVAGDPGVVSFPSVGSLIYVAGGGTAQAQTATLVPAAPSLTAGLQVCWKPLAANTGAAPTLAVNGLTATAITKFGAVALIANDIVTTTVACVIYDGTQFELQNPMAGAVYTATGAFGGTVTTSSTTPSTLCNGGTAGCLGAPNGTAPTDATVNKSVIFPDSGAVWWRMRNDGASNGTILDVAATGVNSIAFSTTPALDLTKGPTQQFNCSTAASAISPTVTGLRSGRHLTLVFIQNGTTACTLTLPATFHGQGTLGTTLSGINVQEFVVSNNGTDLYAIAAMVTNMTGGTP